MIKNNKNIKSNLKSGNNVSSMNSIKENNTVYPTIIAVDFDGTLCEQCWPEIGKPNLRLIGELIYRKSLGDKIILWTCRAGEQLENAVAWCRGYGLVFDAVNDNLPEIVELYGSNSRKITADIYIDDRSQQPWETLLEKVG